MKWLFLSISTFILITAICKGQQKTERHSFAYLKKEFTQPSREFGPAPLWVWNTRITRQLIDSMLQEFKQQSFGGVFIHPRPGLITPYLSEEWLSMWKYAMEKSKQLGLDVWIYDENSYPSGFAGGHVPNDMPAAYNQGQMLRMSKTNNLPALGKYYIALEKAGDGTFRQVDQNTKPNGTDSIYRLFTKDFYYTSPWYGGFSYVDLMVPGVTEKFLDITMRNGYEKIATAEFGKTVKGIFSDEPNIEVWDDKSVRWTPMLFPAFKQKWGYDLEPHLPSLFEETGKWKKVRHDYFSTLLSLFIEHWSKPMFQYTQKNNLEWTGHYWEHEWPSALHVPDNMAMYSWPQRPGIDMLFNQFDEKNNTAQFGNIRSVKELSSVANQLAKKRTLSETYGGGGWELTFKDMKRLGDWEFVLGINTLNQHLAYMSMEGARKYDYPQSFSYHNPWWPYYKGMNEYFTRLSLALSTGKQQNDLLIIEPTTSAWMYYSYTGPDNKFFSIGQNFQSFITRLEKAQVEYDLGCEDIIRDHGRISGGRFVVGQASYKTVILAPGTENIDEPLFELLKKFTSSAGQVLLFDTLQYIEGQPDERLKSLTVACTKIDGLASLDNNVVEKYLTNNGLRFDHPDTTQGDLYHHRRQLPEGQILFLVNSSINEHAAGKLQIKGKDALLLDTRTGKITDYPEKVSGKDILLSYNIPESGSLMLFISNEVQKNKQPFIPEVHGTETPVAMSPLKIERLRPNVLTLDFCDVKLPDAFIRKEYFFKAADSVYKYYGLKEGNPWNTSVQYKDNIIRNDTFSAGRGFEVRYEFNIDDNTSSGSIKAVAEKPGLWSLLVNGTAVRPINNAWWVDKNFAVYDIAKFVRQGSNEIKLVAPRMSIYAEIEPVYIIGNFGLLPDAAGWKIGSWKNLEMGSWKDQGLPLYGHEVSYKKTFTVGETNKNYWVKPGKWKGTVALLVINHRQVAVLTGNESAIDISDYVNKGSNEIELVVTGSLKNTLGPHYNKPKPGLVSPWHWRYVDKQIPGKEYDLYDYGLMEDFYIFR